MFFSKLLFIHFFKRIIMHFFIFSILHVNIDLHCLKGSAHTHSSSPEYSGDVCGLALSKEGLSTIWPRNVQPQSKELTEVFLCLNGLCLQIAIKHLDQSAGDSTETTRERKKISSWQKRLTSLPCPPEAAACPLPVPLYPAL